MIFYSLLAAVGAALVSADSLSVCFPGQCLTGQSNITRLGATLQSGTDTFILLPGQYTNQNQPQSLQQAFSSPQATIQLVNGFSNNTQPTSPSLPLDVNLQPGLLSYPNDLFKGDPTFIQLPASNSTNNATSFNAMSVSRGSIVLSSNIWAAIEAGDSKARTIIWDTVPYISQLPQNMAGQLQLVDVQSAACQPACSANAICTIDGTCQCPPGFTGQSCESCAQGFFGPSCKACPSNCQTCDQGITGTGICLAPALPASAPSNCQCENGTCNGGTCNCNTGYRTDGTGATQCNACAEGFYRDATGKCAKCHKGCATCLDGAGNCDTCVTGLTRNNNDLTSCIAQSTVCPDGTFSANGGCPKCDASCTTCKGGSNQDCASCALGRFFFNGVCVTASSQGVCDGSNGLLANPLQGVCDTCPQGCTACSYSSFDSSTSITSAKCTRCLPGLFLTSDGTCQKACPDGTFIASDGFTCSPCSSSCKTCSGSATTCLTCSGNQLASGGTCTTACPSNTFSSTSSGKCTPCHPDCASCSGSGFNECLSCPSQRPVLTSNKRCVPTCGKTEYFDKSSGSCKSCDASCGSCSGPGSGGCLSCSSSKQVLRAGSCVNVDCGSNTGTAANLGVCLAELVVTPNNGGANIPPVDPNAQTPPGKKGLDWWAILLIVLLSLLLIVAIILCWRWRARKKRAKETENFKSNLKERGLWRRLWRNPFSAWMARRRARRNTYDLERRGKEGTDATSTGTPWSPGYTTTSSGDRRTAIDVPKSISRGSWITMGRHPVDERSSYYPYNANKAGVGARPIPEEDRSYRTKERRGGSDGYSDHSHGRGESRFYGQEIEQDDTHSERTYDLFSVARSPSRSSYGRGAAVASTKKSYSEGDRYDEQSRYTRSRRDYPRRRQDVPDDVSMAQRTDTPSIYSSHPAASRRHYQPHLESEPRSRFSVSTVAPSLHQKKRKPVPPSEKPRQLTEAEMYKMSKLFPDLMNLVSPKKPNNSAPTIVMGDRNPFRQNSY